MDSFTPQQTKAIEARGNVLVQAGAGAGKTRTLVERCARWLREDPRNSLDQILMVTFTEAAAAEMRQRIREELSSVLDRNPNDSHLAEQLALLETANISTLHSFCLQLVRQHFYELKIDPQIAVLPEEEVCLLKEETLTAVLQRHYAGELLNSAAVQELIQVQGRGWDRPIGRLVLRLHEYTQTLPDPPAWFRRQLAAFSQAEPRVWREWLQEILPTWSAAWAPELTVFAETPAVAGSLRALERLVPGVGLIDAGNALSMILAADDRKNRDLWPHGSIGKVRVEIGDFFEEAAFLQSLCEADSAAGTSPDVSPPACPEPLRQDWEWSRSPMATLLELAQEFGAAFAEAKRELGAVDFHDLEQFSLQLLVNSSTGRPTPLAAHWRSRLRLIFVDEYQDINAAQDAILRALGGEGGDANRFLVGDVKQSIYRFRLADPHIFQDYAALWSSPDGGGAVIPLPDNFRSHEAILDFINPFFAALMRPELGGVAFDSESWLRFGNREGRASLTRVIEASGAGHPGPAPHVELHLCLTGESNETDAEDGEAAEEGQTANGTPLAELSAVEREARIIGLRLQEMRAGNFQIWDERAQQHRAVEWADMVILLRSRRNKVEAFAREFARLEIPLAAPRGGFFEGIEIMDLLNLLKLLDNPLQDIEAIAVLRSPLVGLSLDELSTVRLEAPGRYWTALQKFHQREQSAPGARRLAGSGPEDQPLPSDSTAAIDDGRRKTFQKIDSFLTSYARWRKLAREASLSRCLEEILADTHYAAWLLTEPRGAQRQANLPKLLAWARQFDQFHRQGLYRFLRFIEAQREAEIDHEPAPLETGNAVRLMTVHQSKGLEFPVVVAADLGKPFNLADLSCEVILDEKFGVCSRIKPPSTEQRYPSLPYWLAQRRQRTEALGEETRILYVALTRACHTLMLVGTTARKSAEKRWSGAPQPTTRSLLRARNYLDWLGPWLWNATGHADWINLTIGESQWLRWSIYNADDERLRIEPAAAAKRKDDASVLSEARQLGDIAADVDWDYAFAPATVEPAKVSVSTLRRRLLEETDAEARSLFRERSRVAATLAKSRRTGLSASEVGSAHHLFLEFVSLDRVGTVPEIQAEAELLESRGILDREQRAALDLAALAEFWQSEAGRMIQDRREAVSRELPFTARVSTSDLAGMLPRVDIDSGELGVAAPAQTWAAQSGSGRNLSVLAALEGEFIVVQGVVDLAVVLPSEIWLLDFKTDQVNEAELEEKLASYRPQLELYSLALSGIYRRPVTRRWLHFLALRRTVECIGSQFKQPQ